MITEFTPLLSFVGGSLIGLAAVLLMLFHGRIAGMTGILTGILPPLAKDWDWRLFFVIGAIAAPAIITAVYGPDTITFQTDIPMVWTIISGLLVGVGVFFASGCTSGHGVCGLSRLSVRSLAATLTFMAATAATVFVIRHVLGGF
ncbi:YeeE/YedE family protein [Roseibium aestuarii]|uniref:YeeE/YedE family protein n=1 Tax=Roseibium aestuarii TaxID=2600299 RepID=A0ABW4JRR4_9HYPH|nr:YeeE/YedE thiosulfate transporter family protein [Roseibium aestuarii]